jgi:hypothetical protein
MIIPGAANIQAYPTPEMWVGGSAPLIVEVTENDTGSLSLALTDAVYPLVVVVAPDSTEAGGVGLALTDTTYVFTAPPVDVDVADTGSQSSALVDAVYTLEVVSDSEVDAGSLTLALADTVYFLAVVNPGPQNENNVQALALALATYV